LVGRKEGVRAQDVWEERKEGGREREGGGKEWYLLKRRLILQIRPSRRKSSGLGVEIETREGGREGGREGEGEGGEERDIRK
jgi:hypothetical protein